MCTSQTDQHTDGKHSWPGTISNHFSSTIVRASFAVVDMALTKLFQMNRNWRASEASETLSGVYKFELMRYVYIYIYIYIYI